MGHKIAISQADYPDAEIEKGVLDSIDAEVVVGHAASEEELIELAAGVDSLLVEYAQVTESVLDELDELTVVSRYGIGVNNVDIDAASEALRSRTYCRTAGRKWRHTRSRYC